MPRGRNTATAVTVVLPPGSDLALTGYGVREAVEDAVRRSLRRRGGGGGAAAAAVAQRVTGQHTPVGTLERRRDAGLQARELACKYPAAANESPAQAAARRKAKTAERRQRRRRLKRAAVARSKERLAVSLGQLPGDYQTHAERESELARGPAAAAAAAGFGEAFSRHGDGHDHYDGENIDADGADAGPHIDAAIPFSVAEAMDMETSVPASPRHGRRTPPKNFPTMPPVVVRRGLVMAGAGAGASVGGGHAQYGQHESPMLGLAAVRDAPVFLMPGDASSSTFTAWPDASLVSSSSSSAPSSSSLSSLLSSTSLSSSSASTSSSAASAASAAPPVGHSSDPELVGLVEHLLSENDDAGIAFLVEGLVEENEDADAAMVRSMAAAHRQRHAFGGAGDSGGAEDTHGDTAAASSAGPEVPTTATQSPPFHPPQIVALPPAAAPTPVRPGRVRSPLVPVFASPEPRARSSAPPQFVSQQQPQQSPQQSPAQSQPQQRWGTGVVSLAQLKRSTGAKAGRSSTATADLGFSSTGRIGVKATAKTTVREAGDSRAAKKAGRATVRRNLELMMKRMGKLDLVGEGGEMFALGSVAAGAAIDWSVVSLSLVDGQGAATVSRLAADGRWTSEDGAGGGGGGVGGAGTCSEEGGGGGVGVGIGGSHAVDAANTVVVRIEENAENAVAAGMGSGGGGARCVVDAAALRQKLSRLRVGRPSALHDQLAEMEVSITAS
jgi:hypothetical protein